MTELWKNVKDYEDFYQVSNTGKIKNSKNEILKPQTKNGGYKYVNLYNKGKGCKKYIHRLVAIAFIENKNNLNIVNHIDCDKSNNNYLNLEWCTQKHNIDESFKNGLQVRAYNTVLINKITGEQKTFRSMLSASNYLNKKYNVINARKDYLKNNCIEIDEYLVFVKGVIA